MTDQHGPDVLSGGAYPTNDSGNADRLLFLFGPHLRFVPGLGWHRWDKTRWALGDAPQHEAEMCARQIVADGRTMGGDAGAAIAKWGHTSGNAGRVAAAVELLSHRPEVRVEAARLDADPWLLNVANGTIDLRTGTLREHRREDLITKLSPVAYSASARAPRFHAFLRECMAGDEDLVGYMLRWLGYCLTGDVREQVFGLWSGAGANGKSTLLDLASRVWGDYAATIPADELLENAGRHPTGLMDLRGARLATTVEPPSGRRWNESLLKQLTGGDAITARRMRQDPVTFRPTHKLVMACNAKPIVRDQGRGFWRRVHAVPWSVSFEGRGDAELAAKLAAEAPGVLAMCVAGCLAWQRQGLAPPASADAARDDYAASQDVVGAFVDEHLAADAAAFAPRAQLYDAFRTWALASGEYCPPASVLYRQLEERGWRPHKRDGVRGFVGWRWATTRPLALLGPA